MMNRSFPLWLVGGFLLVARSAVAQPSDATSEENSTDYSRLDRPRYESPQNFAFELRFGPYKPPIDEKFSTQPGPFEKAFGNGTRIQFGLEFDWQALRIPYLGTLGPGVGWAYTHFSKKAKLIGSDGQTSPVNSAEDTTLTIMPMYLVGVLRADVFARSYGIPLVPYAKLGLGYALWSTGNGAGTSVRDGVSGRGRSWGTHAALGAAFLLDFLDETSAIRFDNNVGVNNSYIFFEWQQNKLDDFGSKSALPVGTSSWVLGLALEL